MDPFFPEGFVGCVYRVQDFEVEGVDGWVGQGDDIGPVVWSC